MYDPETIIQRHIESCGKYLNDKINPALRRRLEIEIETIKTAPRSINEIERLLVKKRFRVTNIIDVFEAEVIYHEIAALEWLLAVAKLRDTYHAQDGIV